MICIEFWNSASKLICMESRESSRSAENNLLTVVGDSVEFKPATKATTTAILAGHEARAHTGVLNENCVSPHLRL
eukprot:s1458_g3.t1